VLVWTVLCGLLAYALAGSIVSFVPGELVTARLGSLGGSGDVSGEITSRYAALVDRARATSVLLLLGWIVLMLRRQALAAALGQGLAWMRAEARTAPARTRQAAGFAWTAHRTETAVFLAILAAGIALRLHYIGRDIRHDEAWTYMVYARRPAYLTPLLLTDVNHHPLNTLLIQLAVALFGDPAWAIRLPAFLFGVGCVPAAYALARSLGGAGPAAIAAALVAGASPLIEFSVNARGYSGVTCCSLLMLWAGLRAIRSGGMSTWPLVVVAAVLGAYANIVMLLPGIAAFTWFAILAAAADRTPLGPNSRAVLLAGLAVMAGTLFLYIPIFTVSGWDVIASSQGIKSRASIVAALQTIPRFADILMANWARDVGLPVGWAALTLAFASPLLARRGGAEARALLLAAAPALVFQFVAIRDPGPSRIWLPLLAVLLVLLALSLDGIVGRASPNASAGLAAVLAIALPAAVLRSGTLLSSTETAYFPAARAVANGLAGMSSADLFATPEFRGDDVAYYALRAGLVLEPIQTADTLRIYRAKGAPAAAGPGVLRLLLDKRLPDCPAQDCTRVAERLIALRGPLRAVIDEPGYRMLAAERR
jgi:hypothetical protein